MRTIEFCQTFYSKMTCMSCIPFCLWLGPKDVKVIRAHKGEDTKEFALVTANAVFFLTFLVIHFFPTYLLHTHSTAVPLCWILSYCFLLHTYPFNCKLWCCGGHWESLNCCSDFPSGFSFGSSSKGTHTNFSLTLRLWVHQCSLQ